MAAEPRAPSRRLRAVGGSAARPAKLNREVVINAALSFLDREGWDALTVNALAAHLGTKGPSLYNHVESLDDLSHGAGAGDRRNHHDAGPGC